MQGTGDALLFCTIGIAARGHWQLRPFGTSSPRVFCHHHCQRIRPPWHGSGCTRACRRRDVDVERPAGAWAVGTHTFTGGWSVGRLLTAQTRSLTKPTMRLTRLALGVAAAVVVVCGDLHRGQRRVWVCCDAVRRLPGVNQRLQPVRCAVAQHRPALPAPRLPVQWVRRAQVVAGKKLRRPQPGTSL